MNTQQLQKELLAYLLSKGSCTYTKNEQLTHVSVNLLPTLFPKDLFDYGKRIATIYSKLADRIARNSFIKEEKNYNWLIEVLEETGKVDDFVSRQLDLYKETLKTKDLCSKNYQQLQLGILRSDYMVHSEKNITSLLQVELNTISCALGSISTDVSKGHQLICSLFPQSVKVHNNLLSQYRDEDLKSTIEDNETACSIAFALSTAHIEFYKSLSLNDKEVSKRCCILMIVLPNEKNEFDQRKIQFELNEKYDVQMIRKTLKEVEVEGKYVSVGSKTNILQIDNKVVSVTYFRAGYSPTHYPTELEWKARRKIELSWAIKCPSIGYHLAGTKKVQQCYSSGENLEKFLLPEECCLLRESFAKIYSLDENEMTKTDKEFLSKAMKSEDFVLKPQREGGGNNYFGKEVGKKLKSMGIEERKGYIMMQRIYPKTTFMRLISQKCLRYERGMSELGLISVNLSHDEGEIFNKYGGYMLRNKPITTEEGSVLGGYSCLGSLILK